jgi:spoIIIJ-associated protein
MSEQGKTTSTGEGAQAVLENILRLMGFEAKVQPSELPEGGTLFQIESADSSRIIGREGQGLEALQLLVNRMVSRGDPNAVRYMVDAERYRQRQQDEFRKMALDAAELAAESGHEVKLPPMGAADRRIVHQALKNNPKVRTESEETEDGKRVVVFPVQPDNVGNR